MTAPIPELDAQLLAASKASREALRGLSTEQQRALGLAALSIHAPSRAMSAYLEAGAQAAMAREKARLSAGVPRSPEAQRLLDKLHAQDQVALPAWMRQLPEAMGLDTSAFDKPTDGAVDVVLHPAA